MGMHNHVPQSQVVDIGMQKAAQVPKPLQFTFNSRCNQMATLSVVNECVVVAEIAGETEILDKNMTKCEL